ncbi:MAG: hypothetical protein A4E70_01403 [Syntrophus sp. PtaU1.Bin005]|nr:MAG: hypothetical protein A4E69_02674 [Syntrophus sp. PtaB.Bin138]OPY81136.1 MAG: hypothetical protein A4E70_01403 [Syntrophus sp. PtaU1.Bin005]
MNRGYVNVWRRLEYSAVFQNEGLLKVFLWCLFRANYRDKWVTVKTGRGFTEVKLSAGSFIFGRESAAEKLHMSPSTVWKRILKLKKLEILNIESNSHYSVIYIVNWHIYQSDIQNRNSEGDRQGTGKEHREELKEKKHIKSESNTDFDRFYSAYPKHEAKKRAIQVWERINPDSNLLETILSAVEKQKIHKAHLKESGQFCPEWPQPGVWLNNERWTDEIQEITVSGGGSKAVW